MAHFENDRPPMNEASPVLVHPDQLPDVRGGGGGLILPTGQPISRSPEILRSRMDQAGLFHSLRRRWLLATCMGLLVAMVAAFGLWVLFPETNRATCLLRVYSTKPVVLEGVREGTETSDYDVFRNTQMNLVKSHFVLEAALRPQEISEIPAVMQEEDPIQWLRDELDVRFPGNGEIMEISLAGQIDRESLEKIVDSVKTAYIRDVVEGERTDKLRMKEILEKQLDRAMRELTSKRDEYYKLAKELGGSADPEQNVPVQMALNQWRMNRHERRKVQSELRNAYMISQVTIMQQSDPAIVERMVQEAVSANPSLQQFQMQMLWLDAQIMRYKMNAGNRRSGALARLEDQKRQLAQEMQQIENQERQKLMSQYESSPNLMVKLARKQYDAQARILQAQLQALDQQEAEIRDTLTQMTDKNTELVQRQDDLVRRAELVDAMSQKLALWDIELVAGSRVRSIQDAVARERINTLQRYAIAGIGGIIMLGLTCFGIGYMEFQNRRLNGPTQVDEGLGIRVIGTLPSLSGRRVAYEGDPVVASLMESVDSLRTTLMHDAAAKDRRVVLVTSASTLEGRTTVASQLAASLARAGRRTLLIDGDMRHPALHALFDMPLEDGLCEVLRTDAELDEAIRPTHAEGLWLLTAGYCDMDAMHAMANDQLQPLFEKLRGEFDFIIVDGAPVLGLPDSLIIGQNCDAAIVSVLRDYSQVPKIYQAAEQLKAVGVRLLGAVVNGVRAKTDTRVVRPHIAGPRTREEERQPVETA